MDRPQFSTPTGWPGTQWSKRSGPRVVVGLLLLSLLGTGFMVNAALSVGATSSVSFRSASAASGSASSVTLTVPSGTVADDVLVAAVFVRGKATVVAPAGWTLVREDGGGHVYDHVAGVSEPSSYTWSLSGGRASLGAMAAYSGADTVNPVMTSSGQVNKSSTAITAPSLTTTADGAMVVGFFAVARYTAIDAPAGFLERSELATSRTGSSLTVELSDTTMNLAGSTGDEVAAADAPGANVGQMVALGSPGTPPPPPSGPYRAFTSNSYWNTPLPADAPIDPNSAAIVGFIKGDSTTNYIQLTGTGETGDWGTPIFWAEPTDPVYAVKQTLYTLPPEFGSLRIPASAQTGGTSDAPMIVYDLTAGYVAWLWNASYDSGTKTWSAGGGSVHYISSNGLDKAWTGYAGYDGRNTGHRGVPGAVFPPRYDEVQAGVLQHVLKMGVYHTKCTHVFPMVGDECGTSSQFAPPEGTRVRIKPSVDLSSLGLSSSALVIAKTLQDYGAVIGDQSGGPVTLQVENTVDEGRGWLWNGLLSSSSLSTLPMDDFEVIQLGYVPGGTTPPSSPSPSAGASSGPAPGLSKALSPSGSSSTSGWPAPSPTRSVGHSPKPVPKPKPKPTPTPSPAPGEIGYRGASSGANATAATLALPAPSGVRSGDVMVASLTVRAHPTITAPSGWTLIRNDYNGHVMTLASYYRVAGSAEPGSYTWSFSSSQAAAGGIVAYGGVDTRSPVVASSGQVTVDIVNSITAPSVSATAGGEVVLGLFGISTSTSITPPGGLAEHVDVSSSGGSYKATMEMSDLTRSSAGSTGDQVATAGNYGANIGQLVVLRVG